MGGLWVFFILSCPFYVGFSSEIFFYIPFCIFPWRTILFLVFASSNQQVFKLLQKSVVVSHISTIYFFEWHCSYNNSTVKNILIAFSVHFFLWSPLALEQAPSQSPWKGIPIIRVIYMITTSFFRLIIEREPVDHDVQIYNLSPMFWELLLLLLLLLFGIGELTVISYFTKKRFSIPWWNTLYKCAESKQFLVKKWNHMETKYFVTIFL